jgi:hypothetical protein
VALASKIAQLVVLIRGDGKSLSPLYLFGRSNAMDYNLQLNTQEDENAPRGTRYFVDIEREEPWCCVEVWGYSWQEAMVKAIDKLQEIGEI